jgi:hypothetical protein
MTRAPVAKLPVRRVPDPPPDLSAAGRARWDTYAADVGAVNRGALIAYDALAECLAVWDRLDAVRAILDAEGLTAPGSMKQQRPHPLLAVEVSLVQQLDRRLDRLGLAPGDKYRSVTPDGHLQARP